QIIDPAGMARHAQAGDASLGKVVSALSRSAPDYQVTRIIFPVIPGGTYLAYLANADGQALYASVDPGNAAVLRQGSLVAFPTEAVLRIHECLSLGDRGALLVAAVGFALVTMIA